VHADPQPSVGAPPLHESDEVAWNADRFVREAEDEFARS
jgi:hypothetical protein